MLQGLYEVQKKYDSIVCGSDQIWNRFFLMRAEGKLTLSYYLNFVGNNSIYLF